MIGSLRLAIALCATALLSCSSQAEGFHKVVWTPVREGGLVATYLRPKGEVVRHAIIVVGGSEGGIPTSLAYPFAERGWAVLAVAYFGVEGLPDFLVDLQQARAVDAAAIPAELIQGPVLLLSAEDDLIWPSTYMSQRLMARLSAAQHPYLDQHVSYPGAGHLISPGSDPGLLEARHPIGLTIAFGGSRGANRAAQKNALAKAIEFMNKAPTQRSAANALPQSPGPP